MQISPSAPDQELVTDHNLGPTLAMKALARWNAAEGTGPVLQLTELDNKRQSFPSLRTLETDTHGSLTFLLAVAVGSAAHAALN